MSFTYSFLIGLLLVTGLNVGDRRRLVLAIAYTAIWALYAILSPRPTELGVWWYFVCATGEAATIVIARRLGTPAGRFIWLASFISYVANIAAAVEFYTPSNVIYNLYPYIIQTMETAQAVAIAIFSPPVAGGAIKAMAWFQRMKGSRPWMHKEQRPQQSL